MTYANINTGEIVQWLNPTLNTGATVIQNATIEHYAALGWRQVLSTQQHAAGWRVDSFNVVEASPTTCNLTIKTQTDLAAEAAAQTATSAANDKATAKFMAELASDPTGRVVQAFMALTLQEINALRTQAGLAVYTKAQFLNALKSKVDAQT